MYLITEEQFNDINEQESSVWYNLIINLDTLNGIPIKTFTHSKMFTRNLPVQKYLKVIEEGISEAYALCCQLSFTVLYSLLKL